MLALHCNAVKSCNQLLKCKPKWRQQNHIICIPHNKAAARSLMKSGQRTKSLTITTILMPFCVSFFNLFDYFSVIFGLPLGLVLARCIVCLLSVSPSSSSITHLLWLNRTSYGSAMVQLNRAITSFYRLLTVTMSLSAVVWPQFWLQSCCLQQIIHVRRIAVSYPSVYCNVWYNTVTIECMGLQSL